MTMKENGENIFPQTTCIRQKGEDLYAFRLRKAMRRYSKKDVQPPETREATRIPLLPLYNGLNPEKRADEHLKHFNAWIERKMDQKKALEEQEGEVNRR